MRASYAAPADFFPRLALGVRETADPIEWTCGVINAGATLLGDWGTPALDDRRVLLGGREIG